jgi:DNA-binding transcriptional MerR regulator/methylmalonyl-CoA mutase cobalamin-binding subunit
MYRIHVAAEKAGVSTQLLRAWERRYGLLAPSRTDSGYRVYSDDDVSILRGAKVLIDEGRSIAEVARLPHEQLRRAAGRRPIVQVELPAGSWQETALAAVARFDGATVERSILAATGMGALPSTDICDRVLMPLLVAIGDRWEKGVLDVAAEHFGSAIIRRHLHGLVESEAHRNLGAPAVVCACPEKDLHEGGLLAFAVHAAALGWAIVYLGPNTPTTDIIATADRTGASGVAMSLTAPLPATERRKLVESLSAWKRKGDGRRVWIGGRAAAPHVKDLAGASLGFLPDASILDQRARHGSH